MGWGMEIVKGLSAFREVRRGKYTQIIFVVMNEIDSWCNSGVILLTKK